MTADSYKQKHDQAKKNLQERLNAHRGSYSLIAQKLGKTQTWIHRVFNCDVSLSEKRLLEILQTAKDIADQLDTKRAELNSLVEQINSEA